METELIWVKLTPLNQSPIHILCTFYHPPNADSHPIEKLCLPITNLLNQSNTPAHILLIGDFNFPGITWSGNCGQIDTQTYGSSLNKLFLMMLVLSNSYTYRHQDT